VEEAGRLLDEAERRWPGDEAWPELRGRLLQAVPLEALTGSGAGGAGMGLPEGFGGWAGGETVRAGRTAAERTRQAAAVAGVVVGNRLHLRFAQKGGFRAEQWLDLQPGGQVVRNVMIIRKFGIAVARLDETIRRVDGAAPEQ
jgi:hypothetical protein